VAFAAVVFDTSQIFCNALSLRRVMIWPMPCTAGGSAKYLGLVHELCLRKIFDPLI
jgi:hypothetical protein